MIPIIYDALETDFSHNGIGFLIDAISCNVTEERNGQYELELVYPQKGHLSEYIKEDNIIKAKANKEDVPQLFRIYGSDKAIRDNVTWRAEHISYALNCNPVEKFNSTGTAESVMTQLLNSAVLPHNFTAHSDITTSNVVNISEVMSVRNIMGGTEGSILDIFGGEYKFNNFEVWLYKNRGSDSGVTIEYGKNLIDAKQEKNIANVITSIFPYAYYTDNTTQESIYISLPEKILKHSRVNDYANIRCVPIDLSSKWESGTVVTVEMLRKAAQEHLESGIADPEINITVSFAALEKTKDYKNIEAYESVKMCDTVTVKINKLDIDVMSKVVKTKYNVLKERYDSIELGSTKPNLVKTMSANETVTKKAIADVSGRSEKVRKEIEQSIVDITNKITGNSGGYVVLNPPLNPQEIFVMDTADTSTAKNVWRWNLAGLGHSKNGINGEFTTAITADGKIVADFILVGELSGALLKAGTVRAESLDVEYTAKINNSMEQVAGLILELGRFQTTVSTTYVTKEAVAQTATELKNYSDGKLSDYAAAVSETVNGLQQQIDGSITTWFFEYVPTNTNKPAMDWTTADLKNNHLGDLFYNTITGYCYRYQVINNLYSWQIITDTDVTKALQDAAAAQDTADSKRRVFATTPTVPYDIGDLWTQGATGDLMRCKVDRSTGSYIASDWEKASKYTDDTAAAAAQRLANTAQTSANNALGSATNANNAVTDANNAIAQAQQALTALQTTMSTKFTQTSSDYTFAIAQALAPVLSTANAALAATTTSSTYIRFIQDSTDPTLMHILIGDDANKLVLDICNNKMSFKIQGIEVAYMSNNKLNITDAEILNSIKIGKFAFVPRSSGNLSFKFVG